MSVEAKRYGKSAHVFATKVAFCWLVVRHAGLSSVPSWPFVSGSRHGKRHGTDFDKVPSSLALVRSRSMSCIVYSSNVDAVFWDADKDERAVKVDVCIKTGRELQVETCCCCCCEAEVPAVQLDGRIH